ELANKIVGIYGGPNPQAGYKHGIEVASLIAGDTNNDKGMASIGYNTKLIGKIGLDYSTVYDLAQIPGIRVINMSWKYTNYSLYNDQMLTEVRDSLGIVLVAASANGYNGNNCGGIDGNKYCYPASYDAVISVTGVGSKHFRNNPEGNNTNWKDVAEVTIGNSHTTMTVNDKVNVSAPSYELYRATNEDGAIGSVNAYIDINVGTSIGAPLVSGLAALILSVNPNLTALQVKEIIEETTDDIYNIPENAAYIGKLGTGRINAYRAVMRAYCMLNPSTDLDLMIRDSREDYGEEPNVETDGIFWNSIDMWVRNQQDEIEIHENAEYDPSNPAYVYVRIFNRSCQPSSGSEKIKLYWAKASTSLNWDTYWNGQNFFSNGQPLGEPIGEITIPALEPGQDVILNIPWQVPNPQDYAAVNPEPWHY